MLTKAELIEVMQIYIEPFYKIGGAVLALGIILFAWWVVIVPFIRRIRE